MSKIIVFGNEKGGSGKTTTAFHVAIVLLKSSYKILIIDADIRQKSFTRYLENRNQAIQNNNISLEIPEIFNISDEILNNIDEKGSELKKIIEKKKKNLIL